MTTYHSISANHLKHDETKSYNDQINDEVSAMTEFYKGETPSDIPMMPDEIKYEDYRESLSLPDIVANGALPIGLDYEGVTLQKIKLTELAMISSEIREKLRILPKL